jgi:AraC-like DNA-binding protein
LETVVAAAGAFGEQSGRQLLVEEAPTLVTRSLAPSETAFPVALQMRDYPQGGLAPWQEMRAKNLLCAALPRDISLRDVARECGLSLSHFSRAFRKTTGLAPYAWRLRRRIDAAKNLLQGGTMSLAEIGLACGFADQSHFTKIFSRHVGASPGAWRRAVQAAV